MGSDLQREGESLASRNVSAWFRVCVWVVPIIMTFYKPHVPQLKTYFSMKCCTWLRYIGNYKTDIFQLFKKKGEDSNFSFLHGRLQGKVSPGSVRAGGGTGITPSSPEAGAELGQGSALAAGTGAPPGQAPVKAGAAVTIIGSDTSHMFGKNSTLFTVY